MKKNLVLALFLAINAGSAFSNPSWFVGTWYSYNPLGPIVQGRSVMVVSSDGLILETWYGVLAPNRLRSREFADGVLLVYGETDRYWSRVFIRINENEVQTQMFFTLGNLAQPLWRRVL